MVEPYIHLDGQSEAAIAFYDYVFGCPDKVIYRLSDMPPDMNQPLTEETKNLIAYGEITVFGTIIHLSDMSFGELSDNGHISLMIPFSNADEMQAIYDKLCENGKILMPIGPQSFAKRYAFVKDRFGIGWQLIHMY